MISFFAFANLKCYTNAVCYFDFQHHRRWPTDMMILAVSPIYSSCVMISGNRKPSCCHKVGKINFGLVIWQQLAAEK